MLVNQTSTLATRALVYLALRGEPEAVSPARLAEVLCASPTYLSKTLRMLVRVGILHAVRGARGGVLLARAPAQISLRDIVEACQGQLFEDHCGGSGEPFEVCAYHEAMRDVFAQTVAALSRWTLADLAAKPRPPARGKQQPDCVLTCPREILRSNPAANGRPRRGR